MNQTATIDEKKQVISKLFAKAKILKVAYIDDKFSTEKSKEEFVGILKELYKSGDNQEKIKFAPMNAPVPVFEKTIEKIWNNSNDEQRNKYLRILYDIKGKKEKLTNIVGAIELSSYLGEYIELFSPEKWYSKKDDFFEKNVKGDKRVLCIFDKELNLSDGKDGINLLEDVLNGEYYNNTYCAVFSQHISLWYEFDQKREWIIEYELSDKIADKFYTISKETVQEEQWGLIEGIKNVLVVEEVENLKKLSSKIIEKAQEKVIKDLDNLSPETYNQIIQKSSNIEGVWEMNTLFRISNIFQENALKMSITKIEDRVKFNSSISTIRNFDEIDIENNPRRWSKQTKVLRDKEIFEDGKIINALHYPLANGDIFQIKSKKYILLAQPCNLSIRSNGRRDYDFEIASLVELATERPNQHFVKVESHDLYIKFSKHFSLKLDVLDLVVFNPEGISKIGLNTQTFDSDLIHNSLMNRFSKIKKTYTKLSKKLCLLEDVVNPSGQKAQLVSFFKPIVTLNSSLSGIESNPYSREANEFNFGIKRIRRLREPYAMDALQKFMLFLSRNGFDHDFSRSD